MIEVGPLNMGDIQGDIELGTQLGAGGFRDGEELLEFSRASPLEALRDI